MIQPLGAFSEKRSNSRLTFSWIDLPLPLLTTSSLKSLQTHKTPL
jgi:hypothetical protein